MPFRSSASLVQKWLVTLPLLALSGTLACAQDAPAQKVYGRTPAESSPPVWPQPAHAAKGAPNILLIMTDDAGFGITSTFGGVIPTPSLDRIAANGGAWRAAAARPGPL